MSNRIRSKRTYFKDGEWNAACSMCGKIRKSGELVRNWMGQYRCPEHNEPRHPQDFVHAIIEHPAADWVQDDQIPSTPACTPSGMTAIPGLAMPGCSLPGRGYTYLFGGI